MSWPEDEIDVVMNVTFPEGYRGRLAHLIGWGLGHFHRDEEHEGTWGVYEALGRYTEVDGGELVSASRGVFVRASYLFLEALAVSEHATGIWWEIHEFLIKEIKEQSAGAE